MNKFQEMRDKVDHLIYKVESTAEQRDEACRSAIAIYHNSHIDDCLDWEHPKKAERGKSLLLVEIERTVLMLILERDKLHGK